MDARHSRRQDLAGEHPLTDVGQLVLFAVFLAVWITDSFVFRYSTVLAAHVPLYVRLPAGLTALVASALLALSAHEAVFGGPARGVGEVGRAGETGGPGLLSGGPFSVVRHPMYLGSWLSTAGLALATASLASAALSALILLFYYRMARHEEQLLLGKFGDDYRRYQARVAMLLPVKVAKKPAAGQRAQDREPQRYQAVPGGPAITSTAGKTSRSSRRPARRKRR